MKASAYRSVRGNSYNVPAVSRMTAPDAFWAPDSTAASTESMYMFLVDRRVTVLLAESVKLCTSRANSVPPEATVTEPSAADTSSA